MKPDFSRFRLQKYGKSWKQAKKKKEKCKKPLNFVTFVLSYE